MPPLAVPSSLVSTMPVTSTASANCFACTRPFWPVDASIDEQHFLARALGAVDDPAELLQLLHQVASSCAGGPRCRRARDRRSRLDAAAIASNTTEPGSAPSWPRTISPPVRSAHSSQLVGGRGAERVGGGEHDPPPVGDLLRRELADRRGLPDAVHADEHPHVRLARRRACSVAIGASPSSIATTSSRTSAIELVGVGDRSSSLARVRTASSRRVRRAPCRRRRAAAPLRARPTFRRRSCGRACGRTRRERARVRPSRSRSRGFSMTSGSTTSGSTTSGGAIVGSAAGGASQELFELLDGRRRDASRSTVRAVVAGSPATRGCSRAAGSRRTRSRRSPTLRRRR